MIILLMKKKKKRNIIVLNNFLLLTILIRYLVFEYMGGGSLQNLLNSSPNKRLPYCQARK